MDVSAFSIRVLPATASVLTVAVMLFNFETHGKRLAGKCLAQVPLPEYGISEIRTGQFLVNEDGSTAQLWEGDFHHLLDGELRR